MVDKDKKITAKALDWIDVLEDMKKINFFPYVKEPIVKSEDEGKDCPDDNCCGRC